MDNFAFFLVLALIAYIGIGGSGTEKFVSRFSFRRSAPSPQPFWPEATLAGPVAAASLGPAGDYKLLVLNGQRAKWGSSLLGTGASVTYAVATAAMHTDGAFNCVDIVPPDALLAANHIAANDFNAQIAAAFAAWARVADLTFQRIADPAAADIVIGAEGVPTGRAFTNVATTAPISRASRVADSSAASPAAITRSIICLNPQQSWKIGFDGDLNVYDLRYTFMHEIGHAIGLDHPDSPEALMDYHYTEMFSVLQPGDIAGADLLYGARQPSIATVAASTTSLSPVVAPIPTDR